MTKGEEYMSQEMETWMKSLEFSENIPHWPHSAEWSNCIVDEEGITCMLKWGQIQKKKHMSFEP